MKLGLIIRKQNEGKVLEEIMTHLRQFATNDSYKYDFTFFGIGVFQKIQQRNLNFLSF